MCSKVLKCRIEVLRIEPSRYFEFAKSCRITNRFLETQFVQAEFGFEEGLQKNRGQVFILHSPADSVKKEDLPPMLYDPPSFMALCPLFSCPNHAHMKKTCPLMWVLWSYYPDRQRFGFTEPTLKRVDIQPFYRHVLPIVLFDDPLMICL